MSKINKEWIIAEIGKVKQQLGNMKQHLNQLQSDIERFTKDKCNCPCHTPNVFTTCMGICCYKESESE